ncbi:asparaginase [Clostridium sp. 19966]|uniref:asparaginase n=1 Tax=Clostridium sp. 19966 TaxID=2768166 RepID=UPI0028DFCC3F|nr:asparaginase [Clostridium sp. 19966]MDT8716483.1 asparaginase [Clostridium sp. 19966]
MKKVAVVFNGGTISMVVDEKIHAAVPGLSGEQIMNMVSGIERFAEVESYTFSNVPSPHMTIEDMLKLSKYIKNILDKPDIAGVVVTHGTDTLEETAYLVDLTIDSYKPIIFTGAMRSSSELGYDGPFNLASSISAILSEESQNRGVLVCFNGELNSASEVTKMSTMDLNAFRTPTFGPIGIVDNNRTIYYRNNLKSEKLIVDSINAKVDLIKCVAGEDSGLINFCLDKGDNGIIIEALGRGNVPPKMIPGIQRAIDNKVPIVIVSRCFEGRVFESYGYLGGGKYLKDMGVILADNLPGQKARIKLLLALSKKQDIDFVRKQFEY